MPLSQQNLIRAVMVLLVGCLKTGASNSERRAPALVSQLINTLSLTASGLPDSQGNGSLTDAEDDYSDEGSVEEDRPYPHVTNLYHSLQRERSRNFRLQSLQSEILSRLGMEASATVSPQAREKARETLDRLPGSLAWAQPLTDTTQRRCYSASCEVPHRVSSSLWRETSSQNIRLFFPLPRDRSTAAQLLSAKLYLFLKPGAMVRNRCQRETSPGTEVDGEEREEERGEEEAVEEASGCRGVRGLMVSVFQFLRPLALRRRDAGRSRVVNRRRLVDAKFVRPEGNTWVAFNVSSLVMDWRRHRKNFGLEVVVRDDNDVEMDSRALFVGPNCSVGREIGCREDGEETYRPSWFINYRDKFPYVDITVTENPDTSRRLRRSLRHTLSQLTSAIEMDL